MSHHYSFRASPLFRRFQITVLGNAGVSGFRAVFDNADFSGLHSKYKKIQSLAKKPKLNDDTTK